MGRMNDTIATAIITALVMKLALFGAKALPKCSFNNDKKTSLREAVTDSATTVISLCACVMFFMVVGNAVSNILSLGSVSDAILKSVLEFSSGCAEASDEGMYALPLIAFSLGFTGLSVMMQVKSVTEGRLSIKPYFIGKIVGCAVMTFLVMICG